MKQMSQEELDELYRQIGYLKPIPQVPQIRDEDMPTMQEMLRAMKSDETTEEEDWESEEEAV